MDTKPVNWLGTCKDQQELFAEILAYLLAREVLDQNHMCMSCENFIRISRKLIDREAYYAQAVEHFDKLITTWGIQYDNETGVRNQTLDNETLLHKAYQARRRATIPDGKVKKYAAVYEGLE
jgi:hypothetical protein